MECLICCNIWEQHKSRAQPSSSSQYLTPESSSYFCKLLGLTCPSARESMSRCDICNICADQVSEMKVLMKQLESLEKQISIFREGFQSKMLNSFLVQPGNGFHSKDREFTRRWRSEIIHELKLIVEFPDISMREEFVVCEPDPKAFEDYDYEESVDDVSMGDSGDDADSNNTALENQVQVQEQPASPSAQLSAVFLEAAATTGAQLGDRPHNSRESVTGVTPSKTDKELLIVVERLSPTFIESMTKRSGARSRRYPAVEYVRPVNKSRSQTLAEKIVGRAVKGRRRAGKAQYNCPHCERTYDTARKLRGHVVYHRKPEFICNICSKGFVMRNALERHEYIHAEDKPFKCDKCGYSCRDKYNMNKHLRRGCTPKNIEVLDDSTAVPCPHCELKFPTRKRLKSHIISHHEERKYSCETCDKKFLRGTHLRRHEVTHTDLRPYMCDMCPQTYRGSSALSAHKKKCFPDQRPPPPVKSKTDDGLTAQPLEEEQEEEAGASSLCPYCAKIFSTSRELSKHLHCHQEHPRKHLCEFCPKRFISLKYLNRHKVIHFPDRPFTCEYCGKGFKDKTTLRGHALRGCLKNGNIRIKCDVCGKIFKYEQSKEKHKEVHEADPECGSLFPFPCDTCDLWFESAWEAGAHRSAVHLEKHSCDCCEKTFDSSVALRRHRKQEHFCTISMNDKGEWMCPLCDYTAPSKNVLNIHYTAHSTDLPFVCEFCEQRFKRLGALRRHQRNRHKTNPRENAKARESMKCMRKPTSAVPVIMKPKS